MTSLPATRTYYQDRVERGVILFTRGNVTRNNARQWTVKSDTDSAIKYIVTAEGCTCPDAKKRQGICKHQFASIGYPVAVAVLALRKATTKEDAERIFQTVSEQALSLPLGFQKTLTDEYSEALKSAATAWTGYAAWSVEIESKNEPKASDSPTAAPIYLHKECTHADCLTTQCSRDVRIGGIAI